MLLYIREAVQDCSEESGSGLGLAVGLMLHSRSHKEILNSVGSTGASGELGTRTQVWHGSEQVSFCLCGSASALENRGTCGG